MTLKSKVVGSEPAAKVQWFIGDKPAQSDLVKVTTFLDKK